MTLALVAAMVMIPPIVSEALWCEELGVGCEVIEIERELEPLGHAQMIEVVVECIQEGEGTDEEAALCWREVIDKLEEQ